MVTLDLRAPKYEFVTPLTESGVSFSNTTLRTYSTHVVRLVNGVSTLLTPRVVLPLMILPSIVASAQALLGPTSRTNKSNVIGSMRTGSAILRFSADSNVNEMMFGRGFRTAALTRTRSDLFTTICEMAGMAIRKLFELEFIRNWQCAWTRDSQHWQENRHGNNCHEKMQTPESLPMALKLLTSFQLPRFQ